MKELPRENCLEQIPGRALRLITQVDMKSSVSVL